MERGRNQSKLAIFFLDALRYSDITRENTPFLAGMMDNGVSGPLDTLLAYEGIAATILTGTYPTTHGVWTRYYANASSSPFKWIHPFSPILEKLNGSLTSTRAKLVRYGVMRLSTFLAGISYFPGLDEVPLKQLSGLDFSMRKKLFEPECFGTIPSLFDVLIHNGLSYSYIDHGLFDTDASVFHKASNTRLNDTVTVVRFVDLDTASHRYGIGSPERNRIIHQTDSFVQKIVSSWKRVDPKLSVICFADHGMVRANQFVDVERIILSTGLEPFQDFGMFLDSTVARIWGKQENVQTIRRALTGLEFGRVLSQSERAAYHIPSSPRWGELIFLVNPGYVISPNFFEKSSQVKAMHGYDPSTPGLETILIVSGPRVTSARHSHRLAMVDILPTALDLLDLAVPSTCQGNSLLNEGIAS